jgi:hypothetical protein
LTINHIPDEVLLEIFDSYRQVQDCFDQQWSEEYVWFNLAHVCRKWRAIMFTSVSRLDLGITVGPEKPGHIKTILSGHWPILVDYDYRCRDITGSALWRMRAVLMHHHDHVRKIAFSGSRDNFDKFYKVTNYAFPLLESLAISFEDGYEPIPDTFLRGLDLSDLHLRRLNFRLRGVISLASISRFLLSATALTDLYLVLDNAAFSPSSGTTLLTCLRGMPCLRRLRVIINFPYFLDSPSQPSTTKDIVSLPKLTYLFYRGSSVLLDALVAGLSAPCLRDVNIQFVGANLPPIVHLPRFINEIEDRYYDIYVTFQGCLFHLSFLIHSEYTSHCHLDLSFGPGVRLSQETIMTLAGALSTRLVTVEELRFIFRATDAIVWENFIPWRVFLQHFPNVKALRTQGGNNDRIARIFLPDHQGPRDVLAVLPSLEEIELDKNSLLTDESQREPVLAAFEPFVSARQQAGRPVKVFFGL